MPSDGVRAPSATVEDCGPTATPAFRNDRVASSPASGSTPITRQPGDNALQPRATSPTAGRRRRRGRAAGRARPTSSSSSSAAVPAPAMMCGWSNGGITARPAFVGETLADRFAVVALAIVEDDLGAVVQRRGAFHRRCVAGMTITQRDIEQVSGEGDRLRVVAGRVGDDAAALLGAARAARARCTRRGT